MTKRTNKMSDNTKTIWALAIAFVFCLCVVFHYCVSSEVSHILRYEEIEDKLRSCDTSEAEIILKSESEQVKWLYFSTKSAPGREDKENYISFYRSVDFILNAIVIIGGVVTAIIVIIICYYAYQDYKDKQEEKKRVKVHCRKSNRIEHFHRTL